MSDQPYYEVLLAGPARFEQAARAALMRAGVDKSQFVPAHHGYDADPSEGWIAYRADDLQAVESAQLPHGWRLRLHRHAERLPITPAVQGPPPPSPLEEMRAEIGRLSAEVKALRSGSPLPPIGGGAIETPYVISALESPANSFRYPFQTLLSGTGVVGSGDLLVSAQSPAAMAVNVAPGTIWIPGTISGTTGWGSNAGAQTSVGNTNGGTSVSTGFPVAMTAQGSYMAYNDGIVALGLSSSDPTNPRIDLIVATVADAAYAGSANQCVLQVVTGTAASSPAPTAPPANSVVFGSVWVPAAASSITSGDLNDLRVFAQGTHPSRGAVNIATSQSTSSTSYTTLSTPDQVTGIVLPTNGLIAVWYEATWQESVSGGASAGIFLGSNIVEVGPGSGSPIPANAGIGGTAGRNALLASYAGGLCSGATPSVGYTGDVTTGQAVYSTVAAKGGPCHIFAAAGTYTVSVQFSASSGSVTALNRKLWVQALPFS